MLETMRVDGKAQLAWLLHHYSDDPAGRDTTFAYSHTNSHNTESMEVDYLEKSFNRVASRMQILASAGGAWFFQDGLPFYVKFPTLHLHRDHRDCLYIVGTLGNTVLMEDQVGLPSRC